MTKKVPAAIYPLLALRWISILTDPSSCTRRRLSAGRRRAQWAQAIEQRRQQRQLVAARLGLGVASSCALGPSQPDVADILATKGLGLAHIAATCIVFVIIVAARQRRLPAIRGLVVQRLLAAAAARPVELLHVDGWWILRCRRLRRIERLRRAVLVSVGRRGLIVRRLVVSRPRRRRRTTARRRRGPLSRAPLPQRHCVGQQGTLNDALVRCSLTHERTHARTHDALGRHISRTIS